jgi:opacity protein-like surface antigen
MSVAVFFVLGLSGAANAESYVSAYLGAAFGHDDDVQDNTGAGTPGTIEFGSSLAVGAKVGTWFEKMPQFGVQLDFNGHFPTSEKFTFDFGVAELPVGLDVDFMMVRSLTANAMVRYPVGNIRPYAGIGAGIFNAEISDGNMIISGTTIPFDGDNDSVWGWQVLAGVDFIVSPKFSVFAEYKYSRADFEFGKGIGLDVDYTASQLYGGVSYYF